VFEDEGFFGMFVPFQRDANLNLRWAKTEQGLQEKSWN